MPKKSKIRGKKKKKPGKSTSKYKKYKIDGNKILPKRTCPKCGPGIFMAEHKDRHHCGKCGYMEKIQK